VEFPSAVSLFGANPVPGFVTANASIDAGADFLKIDYANATPGTFGNIFRNDYVFTFTTPIALQITNVLIDPSTTLGLTPSRVSFNGNQLILNVSGLSFNQSTVARLNLSGTTAATPDPTAIPEPSTMLGIALASGSLAYIKRRRTLAEKAKLANTIG
jgi:hypothetical protein